MWYLSLLLINLQFSAPSGNRHQSCHARSRIQFFAISTRVTVKINEILLVCVSATETSFAIEPSLFCCVFDFINDVIMVVIKEVTTDSGGFAISVYSIHCSFECSSGCGNDAAGGWLVIAAVYNQVFTCGTLFKAHCVVPRGVKSKIFLEVESGLSRFASGIIDLVVEALMFFRCFLVSEVQVCGLSIRCANVIGGQSKLVRASSLTVVIVFISESPAINCF